MRRRRLLAALGTGLGAAGTAGCLGGGPSGDGAADGDGPPGGTGTATAGAGAGTGTATGGEGTGTPPPGDVTLPVPEAELLRSAARDAIPAITDPATAPDWSGVAVAFGRGESAWTYRPRLAVEDRVVGVVHDGRARAYPLKLLTRHEVVNDRFGGPSLVTYCPLCDSAVVARRTVGKTATTFGVSGLLWRSNLVLYDRATDSLWSQLLARAIRGPRTGEYLELLPATTTTWGEWRSAHPDGDVVLPAPLSGTVRGEVRINYRVDPYRRLDELAEADPRIADFDPTGGFDRWGDGRLAERRRVLGVVAGRPDGGTRDGAGGGGQDDAGGGDGDGGDDGDAGGPSGDGGGRNGAAGQGDAGRGAGSVAGGAARAYPADVVRRRSPVTDRLGGVPVVVAAAPGGALAAYRRTVDGEVLAFRAAAGDGDDDGRRGRPAGDTGGDGASRLLAAGGSRWRVATGLAVDGPHEGRRLRPTRTAVETVWFAWLGTHPGTTVYGRAAGTDGSATPEE